jgi:hypothetical protein
MLLLFHLKLGGLMMSWLNLGAHEVRQETKCDWNIPEPSESEPPGALSYCIALPLFFIAAAAATAGASHTNSKLAPAAFVLSAFFFTATAAVLGMIAREHRIVKHENNECDKDCEVLRHALNRIPDCTLKGLAYVNFRQLRVFTVIAQRQARMSYYASLTAASIALLVLMSGATVAYGLTDTPAKITAASLAVAGGALSGFLAATFLKTYVIALRQMSYYYGQPLVHCYLLHAEWLASTANKHVREQTDHDLWKEVIKASIQASANAQEQLLSLQEADFAESRRRNGKSPVFKR